MSAVRRIRTALGALALCSLLAPAAHAACAPEKTGAGDATFYGYLRGSGACSFTDDGNDAYTVAMNPSDYASGAMCGRWIQIWSSKGSTIARVVDLCPSCNAGDVDLSASAFQQIADTLTDGRVAVQWSTLPDPATATMSVLIDPGSNPFFVAVQIQRERYGLAALEYLDPVNGWLPLTRQPYNRWNIASPLPLTFPIASPFSLRATDVNGGQVVLAGITLTPGSTQPTGKQFPACGPLSAPGDSPPVTLALRTLGANPFSSGTRLELAVSQAARVSLRIFDANGRAVRTLLQEALTPGRYAIAFDSRDDGDRALASGVYFAQLVAGPRVVRQRLVLAR